MKNMILEVNRVEDYMRKEMPEGVGPLVKFIPLLLRRIKELENSLRPFALIGDRSNDNKPLTLVYHKDCVAAGAVLSPANAKPLEPLGPIEYPAE